MGTCKKKYMMLTFAKKILTTRILSLLIFISAAITALGQNVYFDNSTKIINQTNTNVSPGDTIFLESGSYDFLLFQDIQGDSLNPITITNYNGEVEINNDHYFGISFQNCQYIHLTGTHKYGIRIKEVTNGAGIGISQLSNYFEIDNIEVANTKIAGIMCKTDPGCDYKATRDSFLMEDIHIHDNYIHHTGTEGMYIGNSNYFGTSVNCNGQDTLLMPHLLKNVSIHDNLIKHTGWDGLQVSSAIENCAVYGNRIYYDSQEEQDFQMSGLIVGTGSDCDCYNNRIAYGKGIGIEFYGTGGQRIFNNIIIEAGKSYFPNDPTKEKYGIYLSKKEILDPDSAFYLYHNTIIRPKSDGIRFNMSHHESAGNKIQNNIIIDPGAYSYYEDLNTFRTGNDAYVFLKDTTIDVTISHNIFRQNLAYPRFLDTSRNNFTLRPSSPAIDSGVDLLNDSILFDFYYNPRPYGNGYDIGAFEYDPHFLGKENKTENKTILFPNPAQKYFKVKGIDRQFHLSLLSFNGTCLYSTENYQSGDSVSTKAFAPGMYFVKLTFNDGQIKLLKLIIH
ncbi:MAG: right-handed parallel beta-helix repeat-containing protein [Bacteroidales bacterium]|nr:right-handed parallel beta-helix repeat-containing protein [Bacteroidales bacterium]MCF8326953.1 right-handed parallel beta-helix repeat-containing protein [Bacteroidales bacterium]